VLLAEDGSRALERIEAERPALVLLDMNLPVIDGWTVCETVRANPDIATTRIIALTAHAMAEDREKALRSRLR
jgi:two-component system cell cycle response regulator DivK